MKYAALLLICPFLLCSCTIKPTVVTSPNGTQTATIGGSLMSKTASENSKITLSNGTVLEYNVTGLDETGVPLKYIGSKTTLGVAERLQGPANNAIKLFK